MSLPIPTASSTSSPVGANLSPPHLPGFEPIFLAVVQSFLKGKDVKELSDEIMDAILEQSEKFTNKLLAKYPSVLPIVIHTPPLPSTWRAGADIPHAAIPASWADKLEK